MKFVIIHTTVLLLSLVICGARVSFAAAPSVTSLSDEISRTPLIKDKIKLAKTLSKIKPQNIDELNRIFILIKTENDDVDFWVLRSMKMAGDKIFAAQYMKGLKDSDNKIRLYSAYMLGQMSFLKAEKDIIELFKKDPEPMYAQALASMKSKEGLAVLKKFLKEGNPRAVQGMLAYGIDGLSETIVELRKTKPNQASFHLCLAIIEKTIDPNSVYMLEKLLKDTNKDIIHKAAHALEIIKNPETPEIYVRMLAHIDTAVINSGKTAITEIQDENFIDRIIGLTNSSDMILKQYAIKACGTKKIKKAVPDLEPLLSNENKIIRNETAQALTVITGTKYTPKEPTQQP